MTVSFRTARTMSTQRPLTSFFKRASPAAGEEPRAAKRARTVATAPTTTTTTSQQGLKTDSDEPDHGEGTLVMESGWKAVLDGETRKPYFLRLKKTLVDKEQSGKVIYPPKDMIFRAFDLSPWENTRVVIIGQDPYHGPGQANGLAFSVQKGVTIPPSLRNIIKEAMDDVGIKKPDHGCLEPWAQQGVLLLNAVLTVEKGSPNSHKGLGWETFTDKVIRELNSRKSGLVFMLWGKPAQKKASFVDRQKHHVIMSSHPSPLGATKTNQPFITSKCFSRANEFLKKNGQHPIDWELAV